MATRPRLRPIGTCSGCQAAGSYAKGAPASANRRIFIAIDIGQPMLFYDSQHQYGWLEA